MNSMDHIFGISGLIAKHLTGAHSADEQQSLDAWLKEDENHVQLFNRIVAHESLAAALIEMEQVNTELALANVKSRISTLAERKPIRLWPRVAGIAAAVAMVVFGVWFFNYRGEILRDALDDKSVVVNDIAPGKNGATITLANGKVIQLSDAKSGVVIGDDKLAYNDGEILRDALDDKNNNHKNNNDNKLDDKGGILSSRVSRDLVASTTKGQTYEFTLPDGTHVWLNADSKLEFPSQFSGKERKILLEGEAYFEVAKNKKLPFIVESGGQRVEVLGTHFNINAYQDEGSIKTTLLEGSVSVRHAEFSSASRNRKANMQGVNSRAGVLKQVQDDDRFMQDGEAVVLKPNQQAIMTGNKLDVIIANIEQTIAWKNGMIVFQKQSLQDIMRGISRWYDVEVVYEPGLENILFTGSISRFKDISSVLHILELTGKVHFKIEGRRLTVMK